MKTLIIGSVASGKTTFAAKLAKSLKQKVYGIDSIVYTKDNQKRTNDEQNKIINKINKNNDWIIEGTLRKNLEYLLDLADQIIYLDIPINVRKYRIIKRYIKQVLKKEQSDYKPSLKILKKMFEWTKEDNNNYLELMKKLHHYPDKLLIIKNNKDL